MRTEEADDKTYRERKRKADAETNQKCNQTRFPVAHKTSPLSTAGDETLIYFVRDKRPPRVLFPAREQLIDARLCRLSLSSLRNQFQPGPLKFDGAAEVSDLLRSFREQAEQFHARV